MLGVYNEIDKDLIKMLDDVKDLKFNYIMISNNFICFLNKDEKKHCTFNYFHMNDIINFLINYNKEDYGIKCNILYTSDEFVKNHMMKYESFF